MNTVDIVIPVHNSVHWLAWCLEELFRFESVRLRNVFVVNDRSEISQTQKLNEIVSRHSGVELIINEDDAGGFGFACNLGASKCSSDVVLFLNTDCLLTENLIDRLCEVFDKDSQIALACPFSNNSANLTYPMFPGFSYRDMANLFAEITSDSGMDCVVEACTIVGNCLMIRRDFFSEVGGFSADWGIGYGEETDLHMKALARGLKGVVHTGCYVYHFGGGTFNYESEIEILRERNYRLFMSRWSKEYNDLAVRCQNIDPIKLINRKLEQCWSEKGGIINLDVLFYLPGIAQDVGGFNAVIAICNDLVRRGLKATIALKAVNNLKLKQYKEPVLFNFVHYDSDDSFLKDHRFLPKVVFSTIFWSAPLIAEFAAARNAVAVQFVQGYEGYFENGTRYVEAIESYKSTDYLVTTSNWLFEMVSRHLSAGQTMQRLPLVINDEIFFSGNSPRTIDIVFIFRSSPDKGQWILAELLDRLVSTDKTIAVLCAPEYSFLKAKYKDRIQFTELPADQYTIAKIFRQTKIFVDKSLHEGYGLIPLEAALCGCSLVLSDSGGVRDFVYHHEGELITHLLDLESIIATVNRSLENFDKRNSGKSQSKQVDSVQMAINAGPVKNTSSLLLQQVSSGKMWYDYFQDITKDKSLPAFSSEIIEMAKTVPAIDFLYDPEIKYPLEPIRPAEEILPPENMIKKFYKSYVFPYIPQRLHLLLKILISKEI